MSKVIKNTKRTCPARTVWRVINEYDYEIITFYPTKKHRKPVAAIFQTEALAKEFVKRLVDERCHQERAYYGDDQEWNEYEQEFREDVEQEFAVICDEVFKKVEPFSPPKAKARKARVLFR